MKIIRLTKGLFTLVDDSDFEFLSQFNWHSHKSAGGYYAATRFDGGKVYLHRFLMKPAVGMDVDHINALTLDNRRINLCVCTTAQNIQKKLPKCVANGGFIGVRKSKSGKRFSAFMMDEGKQVVLGTFDTPEEAAMARDQYAISKRGEFAVLNFENGVRKSLVPEIVQPECAVRFTMENGL